MKKIVLTGYMGSGKSTIAKFLSEKLQLKALDLDKIIEQQTGMSIAEIFERKGEVFFRKLEHQQLKEILARPESFVLSLGGGTPCYSNNHELLKGDHVISVYLKASIDTLSRRLMLSKAKRPLIADLPESEIPEFIAKHLFDRNYYYSQSKFKVSIDGKTIEEIASEILDLSA